MKIQKLNIKRFRHFEDVEIEFGEVFTVISGQNGTGKSSILGWIAQLFDFKSSNKRINGKAFNENFSNVFRFCPINDYKNKYEVEFHLQNSGSNILKNIKTRHVKKTKKSPERYRTDVDGRDQALDFPIIYLGLQRLIPLATEDKITKTNIIFSTQQKNLFSKLSKEILILIADKISPESINTRNKDLLAMQTNKYGHLGNSAGQDNIGQFISSILSFQKLKMEQGNEYKGGIILIDEIDASLYAASQIKLVNILYKYSKSLNLQIVFTTHSLEILEHLESKLGPETKINHLMVQDSQVKNKLNPKFQYISDKIKNQISNKMMFEKIDFICEDKPAEYWIKNLLNGQKLKSKVNIEKGPFSEGELRNMSASNHKLFKDVGFVLDGDSKIKFTNKKKPKRTLFLPGTEAPEVELYNFIKSLNDDDEFWDDETNFTKQTCFGDYQTKDLSTAKRWFTDPVLSVSFGRGYSKLFNRWKKGNPEKVQNFIKSLEKVFVEMN